MLEYFSVNKNRQPNVRVDRARRFQPIFDSTNQVAKRAPRAPSNELFDGVFHKRDKTFSAASVEEITG
jgi:hypothetical protein